MKMKTSKKKNSESKKVRKAVNEAEKARRLAQSAKDRSMVAESRAEANQNVQLALSRVRNSVEPELENSQYLRTLLDPETYGPCSYPDTYGDDVTLGKFILRKNVNFDSQGNFFIWVNPTLKNILTMNNGGFGSMDFQMDLTYDVPTVVATGSYPYVMPINSTNWSDIGFVQGYFSSQYAGAAALQIKNQQNIILPTGYSGGTINVVSASIGTSTGGTTTWQIVYNDGTTAAITPDTPLALVAGKLSFRIQAKSSLTLNYLSSVCLQLSSITIPVTANVFLKYSVDDLTNIIGYADDNNPDTEVPPMYEEWRPVALSVLVSFSGSTIYNGGRIAGRYLHGGETPGSMGVTDYASLASKPKAFDGPVKTGAYGWWKPTDPKDVNFIDPSYDNTSGGDLPSLLFAGQVTDPTNAQVSVRVCIIAEAKTTVQLLPTQKSRVCPAEIAMSNSALQNMPFVMENPLHLKDIGRFLSNTVKGAEAWWKRNGDSVATLAAKTAKYAPMVLSLL